MKSKYRIKIAKNKQFGEIAAILTNAPDWMEPTNGFNIAHDIIEHPVEKYTNAIGSLDEITTMGATCYFRLKRYPNLTNHRWRNFNEIDICATVETECENLYWESVNIPRIKSRVVNYTIEEIVDNAAEMFVSEISYQEEKEIEFPFDKKQLIYYMQLGERLFKKRFRMVPLDNVAEVWKLVSDKVDNFIMSYIDYQGICADIVIDWNKPSVLLIEDELSYFGE